jgi:mRNA-degrading endonuclease RelE of RelBE toxin-antitoxin system
MARRVVVWSTTARAELRAIDRETARQILEGIDRYLETGAGDVKKLQPPRREFRLRIGEYRVLFLRVDSQTIEVLRVRHRSKAYR